MQVTESTVERVANVAAEECGFRGTDATPLIALGEYHFLAKKDDGRGSWKVLFRVPEWAPGGPGFKFLTVDTHEVGDWIENRATLSLFGHNSPEQYKRNTPEIHQLRDYLQHAISPHTPGHYFDEPMGANDAVEALRKHHA
jgi:hypothetical protein